jgi:hypothetical protein
MTSGHLDEEPATERATRSILDAHPDLAAFLATEPVVSRQYEVPYLGGISKDGKTVYIDKGLPDVLPKTQIPVDKYVALHERSEWWLMTRLGLDYLGDHQTGGHPFAVRIEHDALIADGFDPDAYEDELAAFIKADETERVSRETVPPDLFQGPYRDDQDALDRKILPILEAAAAQR